MFKFLFSHAKIIHISDNYQKIRWQAYCCYLNVCHCFNSACFPHSSTSRCDLIRIHQQVRFDRTVFRTSFGFILNVTHKSKSFLILSSPPFRQTKHLTDFRNFFDFFYHEEGKYRFFHWHLYFHRYYCCWAWGQQKIGRRKIETKVHFEQSKS